MLDPMDACPVIRKARASDAAVMKRCVDAAYRRYVQRMGKLPGPMLDDYAEVVRQHMAFVAETDGEVVGVLVLMRKDSGMLLDNIAVHPVHQGRGLGRRLLDFAESESRKQGCAWLDLYTHETMTENIALYTARRFVETGRRTELGYDRVYMRKAL